MDNEIINESRSSTEITELHQQPVDSQPQPAPVIDIKRSPWRVEVDDDKFFFGSPIIRPQVFPHLGNEDQKRNNRKKMSKLLSGFKRFHKSYFNDNKELFETLRNSQSPKTLLIGCCDSRCDPAIITDCDPGDLFIIRNVANLVAPYDCNHTAGFHGVSAALEFAVKGLNVENIIVMGHNKCGGILALMQGVPKDKFEFIESWMSIAQRAKDKVLKNFADQPIYTQAKACEQASILCSLENLTSYPWITDKLSSGELSINGWYFDFEKGELLGYNPSNSSFEPLVGLVEGDSPCNNEMGAMDLEK